MRSGRMRIKTEHSGAKNGGGYWGYRSDAKILSKVKRRIQSKLLVEDGLSEASESLSLSCQDLDEEHQHE